MGRVLEPEVMEGDEEATTYDELDRMRGDVIFQGFAESALRMGVRRGAVLDVGTGSGRVAIRLAKLNPAFTITAVDLSQSMLELAERNARREGAVNLKFEVGDAKRLPYRDHTFDLVISHQLLHQLPDPVIALREIDRVAKPGGGLLVRDVRRLAEPFMSLVLPVWAFGYSRRLRQQCYDSFRAGLNYREFQQLVVDAGIARATVRPYFLSHQGVERRAQPSEPGVPAQDLWRGSLVKSFYVSR